MDKKRLVKLLSFLCMSDGSLSMHKECVNASFHMALASRNRDLVEFSGELLDHVGVGYKIADYVGPKEKTYTRISSKVHPFLTALWERIYHDGRRTLDPHAFAQFDWEAMAILYMSDGNIQYSKGTPYPMLNMCRLTYAEQTWLKHQIKEKLGVEANVHKCGKYWRLGFLRSGTEKFFSSVSPYILPSFAYKLPNEMPQQIVG